jgi:uncharacterized protein (DUF885 family)
MSHLLAADPGSPYCPAMLRHCVCLLLFGISFSVRAQTAFEQACSNLAARQGDDPARLHELLKLDWEHTMQENPEFATAVGYPGLNDRWSDLSLEAIAQGKRQAIAPLNAIQSIDRSRLNESDQLNYDLFKYNSEQAVEGTRFKDEYLPVTQMDGLQQNIARLLAMAPHARLKDYQDILARLNAIPLLLDQTVVLLKQGLEAKITPPRITLRDVPAQVQQLMVADAQKSPLLTAFVDFPGEIASNDRDRLKQEAESVLKEKAVPAFSRLYDFLVKDYLPKARETIALRDLPDGKEWYQFKVRANTTTSLTIEQIHQLGLSEVKRIRSEMDTLIASTGFKGSFSDFSKFLRTDPRFFYPDADSLLRGYRDIAKRADPELARLFGKLPRLPYGVKAVPD